jgi:hypothetical protein
MNFACTTYGCWVIICFVLCSKNNSEYNNSSLSLHLLRPSTNHKDIPSKLEVLIWTLVVVLMHSYVQRVPEMDVQST